LLPVASRELTAAPGCVLLADADADKVKILDETDWPGGVVQKFRALRPLVEGLVDG
jgi:hypothetical protein